MTGQQAFAHVGQLGVEAQSEDWSDWYPVVDNTGRITHVVLANETTAAAAERGWIFDSEQEIYRADGPLAEILTALLRPRDDGASRGEPRARAPDRPGVARRGL